VVLMTKSLAKAAAGRRNPVSRLGVYQLPV